MPKRKKSAGPVAQEAFRRRARLRGNTAAGTHPTAALTKSIRTLKSDALAEGVALDIRFSGAGRNRRDPTQSKQIRGRTRSTAGVSKPSRKK